MSNPSYHHQQQQQQQLLSPHDLEDAASPSSSNNYNNNYGDDVSGSLDCALLESLFYNEMIKMDHLLSPSQLFQQSLSGVDGAAVNHSHHLLLHDPTAAAEQALLRDFGVTDATASTHHRPAVSAAAAATVAQAQGATGSTPITTTTTTGTIPLPSLDTSLVTSTSGSNSVITQRLLGASSLPAETDASNSTAKNPMMMMQQQPNGSSAVDNEDKQRKKLMAQFTTLASRLGIELPPQALQSLTGQSSSSSHGNGSSQRATTAAVAAATSSLSAKKPMSVEAAAALLLDESESDTALGGQDSYYNSDTDTNNHNNSKRSLDATSDPNDSSNNNNNNNNKTSNKPRRKKPRLSDCDNKLSQLQEENAMLKARLHSLQNKNLKTTRERQEQETKLHSLLASNSTREEMERVIHDYQEMYSDYGKRRDQELLIHLQQLQRLANPTNVTKMGLWTLGQGPQTKTEDGSGRQQRKKNPIVGLLQKELNMTTQQSKKILEQREKIRQVCANLREVSISWNASKLIMSVLFGSLGSYKPYLLFFFSAWDYWPNSRNCVNKRLASFMIDSPSVAKF